MLGRVDAVTAAFMSDGKRGVVSRGTRSDVPVVFAASAIEVSAIVHASMDGHE